MIFPLNGIRPISNEQTPLLPHSSVERSSALESAFYAGLQQQQDATWVALPSATWMPHAHKVAARPAQARALRSPLSIPLRCRREAATALCISSVLGVVDGASMYMLPRAYSAHALGTMLGFRAIQALVMTYGSVAQAKWRQRCAEQLSLAIVERFAGASELAENVQAAHTLGTASAQLESVTADCVYFLSRCPSAVGNMLPAAIFMITQPGSAPPLLVGTTVGVAMTLALVNVRIRPDLEARMQEQSRETTRQLQETAPVLACGTAEQVGGWYARRVSNLKRGTRLTMYDLALNCAAELLPIAVTALTYYAIGWLHDEPWTQERRDTIMTASIVSSQIGYFLGMIPDQISSYQTIRKKAGVLQRDLDAITTNNLETFIRWDDIEVHYDGGPYAVQHLLDAVHARRPGRWCVTGRNGAGKSTLLRLIKKRCGDDAILLPARPQTDDAGCAAAKLSSGELQLERLGQALHADRLEHVLLLDEWSAHLHARKVEQVSAHLENLKRHKLIIEIRHGANEGITHADAAPHTPAHAAPQQART